MPVLHLFEIIQINYYPIHKKQLYSHFCSVIAYIGGRKIDYMRSALTFKLSSSPTESEERATSVVSTVISSSLHLQSTGTQPNVLFVGRWARKPTVWCGIGVSHVHATYGCEERRGNITTVRDGEVMQGTLNGRYIQSSCCSGSVSP